MISRDPIRLSSFGIVVTPATITDEMGRSTCPHCNRGSCCYSCEGSTAQMVDGNTNPAIQSEEEVSARLRGNGALDGITSLILACYAAGIEINTPAFLEAIETAVQAVENAA